MSGNPVGYYSEVGAGYGGEGVASTTGLEIQSITIDATTLDAANPDGSTDLRKYLTLAPQSNGKYAEFSTTDHTSSDLVILAENIYSINDGDQVAKAIFSGTFKSGFIVESDTVSWDEVQRIRIRNE